MRNAARNPATPGQRRPPPAEQLLPAPTPQFRRRAWLAFQRALDPLAPPKRLPPPSHG